MHVMTISSLLISVSYYEKKNNKDKKKKQNKAKKIIKTMLTAECSSS